MPADYRETVASFIAAHGPSLPLQIAKHMNLKDSFVAGAMLSEMTSKGHLKISNLKVGWSPLYYRPGQEIQLVKFAEYLPQRERESLELLQKRLVIRDLDQSPVMRAALRNISDFAIPLDVSFGGKTERFWKWMALGETDTAQTIKGMIQPKPVATPQPASIARPPAQPPETTRPQVVSKAALSVTPTAAQRPIAPHPAAQIASPAAQRKARPVMPKTAVSSSGVVSAPATPSPTPYVTAPVQKPQRATTAQPTPQLQTTLRPQSRELPPVQPHVPLVSQGDPANDKFLSHLMRFFTENNIKIVERQCLKKASEYDFVLKLPSVVGDLTYYCKAKAKKRIADTDVSAAWVQGQLRKLPVLFIGTGELAKRAQELVSNELLGLTYKQLEGYT